MNFDFQRAWNARIETITHLMSLAGNSPYDWMFTTDKFGNVVAEFIGGGTLDDQIRRARWLVDSLTGNASILGVRRRGTQVWIALMP